MSTHSKPEFSVERVSEEALSSAVSDLAALLRACVSEGAGVGFLDPLSAKTAEAFWWDYAPALANGDSYLFVVRQDGTIVATVTLALAPQDNGRHRAEVAKLLVHPNARRQGLAKRLLDQAETAAQALGRCLLVLDTVTGDTAEKLYANQGYIRVGVIPDYALGTKGGMDATTVFYKRLETPSG